MRRDGKVVLIAGARLSRTSRSAEAAPIAAGDLTLEAIRQQTTANHHAS